MKSKTIETVQSFNSIRSGRFNRSLIVGDETHPNPNASNSIKFNRSIQSQHFNRSIFIININVIGSTIQFNSIQFNKDPDGAVPDIPGMRHSAKTVPRYTAAIVPPPESLAAALCRGFADPTTVRYSPDLDHAFCLKHKGSAP